MKNNTKIGFLILLSSLIWWYMETNYFGWCYMPSCLCELICDGFVLLGNTIACYFFIKTSPIYNYTVNINNTL